MSSGGSVTFRFALFNQNHREQSAVTYYHPSSSGSLQSPFENLHNHLFRVSKQLPLNSVILI